MSQESFIDESLANFESEVHQFLQHSDLEILSYIQTDYFYVSAQLYRQKDFTNVLKVLKTYNAVDHKVVTFLIFHNFKWKLDLYHWKRKPSNFIDYQWELETGSWQDAVQKFFFNPTKQITASTYHVKKLFDLCFYKLSTNDVRILRYYQTT